MKNFSDQADIEEVAPDEADNKMLKAIISNPDCQSFVPQEEVLRELGL